MVWELCGSALVQVVGRVYPINLPLHSPLRFKMLQPVDAAGGSAEVMRVWAGSGAAVSAP